MGTKGTNKTEMLKEYAVITAGIFFQQHWQFISL
mgnify:CR=1 FL=1